MNQFYRQPAIDKKFAEISRETDVWVRLTGTIVDVSEDSIAIDDGTGVATLYPTNPEISRGLSPGDYARAICRVIPTDDGFELRVSIIQKIENRELYLKVLSFLNEQ